MSLIDRRSPKPSPAPEAVAATQLLTRVIALMEEMIVILNEEIPLVEGHKRVEHAELLKRKQRLTLDYRAGLKNIVLNPNQLRFAPEDLRHKARLTAIRLAEASESNARTLRAVIIASQRLVKSIIALVKQEVLPNPGYGNFMAVGNSGSYSPQCKPVTVFKTA